MLLVQQTDKFSKWLHALKDRQARSAIQARIDRLRFNHFGDVKPVGEGVAELRIHMGAGYRVYFMQQGQEVIVLLAGGTKSGQSRDIQAAMVLARKLRGG